MEPVSVVNRWKDTHSNESMDILFFKRLICYNLVHAFILNKKQTFLIQIYSTFRIKRFKRSVA